MASRWLREMACDTGGNQSGFQHLVNCLAWFFLYGLEDLGWVFTGSIGAASDSIYSFGTQGEFNLTGTDTNFRDSTIDPAYFNFIGAVGKYLVCKSSDNRTFGIYKITAAIDAYTGTLDFRAGAAEFPTPEVGMAWWVFAAGTRRGSASIECPPGSGCQGVIAPSSPYEDGQNVNHKTYVFLTNDVVPPAQVPPDPRQTSIIAPRRFNANNTLVGKTLRWTYIGTPYSCTFTGTANPVGINDAIAQLGVAGCPAYRADGLGWPRSDSWYISYCDATQPYSGAVALVESGSDAWSDLGLDPGGSYLSTSNPYGVLGPFKSGTRPLPIPDPESTAHEVALAVSAAFSGWLVSDGAPANKALCHQAVNGDHDGWGGATCGDGYGHTVKSSFFTLTSPDGWAIQFAIGEPFSGVYLEVYVSPNGIWEGSDAKVLGPVYLGSTASVVNWLYIEADEDGKWVNVFVHQPTANNYNGIMAGRLIPFETSDPDETVVLLGASGSYAYGYSGNFKRTFATAKDSLGQGFIWSNSAKQPVVCAMVEPSYVDGASGLSKWTSRERNSRASGSTIAGGTTGDSLAVAAGVVTLTKAGTPFRATDAGKMIALSGCANAGNNGIFPVTEYVGPTQIKFTNADAVDETSAFAWTMDAEDAAEGTIIVTDVNNASGAYRLAGRMQGHVSCRSGTVSGWANRKMFQVEGEPKFHVNDGIAIAWPTKVTPQH